MSCRTVPDTSGGELWEESTCTPDLRRVDTLARFLSLGFGTLLPWDYSSFCAKGRWGGEGWEELLGEGFVSPFSPPHPHHCPAPDLTKGEEWRRRGTGSQKKDRGGDKSYDTPYSIRHLRRGLGEVAPDRFHSRAVEQDRFWWSQFRRRRGWAHYPLLRVLFYPSFFLCTSPLREFQLCP